MAYRKGISMTSTQQEHAGFGEDVDVPLVLRYGRGECGSVTRAIVQCTLP
jgi:hypothetical protein